VMGDAVSGGWVVDNTTLHNVTAWQVLQAAGNDAPLLQHPAGCEQPGLPVIVTITAMVLLV